MTSTANAPTKDLLPCPFCGGKADSRCTAGPDPDWFVECTDCRASASVFSEDKLDGWNLRVPQPGSEPVARSSGAVVHRYKAIQLISAAGGHIGYAPHGPDVVMAEAYDQLHTDRSKCWEEFKALRLSADAVEADLRSQLEERDSLLTKMKALFRVDDPFNLYDSVCELLPGEEPYQGIPGTSFQRLNALANQGE